MVWSLPESELVEPNTAVSLKATLLVTAVQAVGVETV